MLTLAYLKFISLNAKTRLAVGFSVLVILLALFELGSLFLLTTDYISRTASRQTYLYLQLDLSKADSLAGLKLEQTLLDRSPISTIDRHLLGDKLGLICNELKNGNGCALIISGAKPNALKSYLKSEQIAFKQLPHRLFAISSDEDALQSIKFSYNPINYLQFRAGDKQWRSLTLALRQPRVPSKPLEQIAYLGISPSMSYYQGQAENGWLAITQRGRHLSLSDTAKLPLPASGQLAISLAKPATVNPALQTAINDARRADQPAYKYKTVTLTDGTRVTELYPLPTIGAAAASGTYIGKINGNPLLLQYSPQSLQIASNASSSPLAENRAFVSISALPDGSLKSLLAEFYGIFADNDKVILY